jgi:hypothetical protein
MVEWVVLSWRRDCRRSKVQERPSVEGGSDARLRRCMRLQAQNGAGALVDWWIDRSIDRLMIDAVLFEDFRMINEA